MLSIKIIGLNVNVSTSMKKKKKKKISHRPRRSICMRAHPL